MKPPPKNSPGPIVTLDVGRVGAGGDGIAEHDGHKVYLPFTAPGDRVRVMLGEKREGGRAGRVIELIEAGARQPALCPHFGQCGGCALQHLAEPAYRAMKEEQIRAALLHRGLDPGVVAALRRVGPGTRRRARLTLQRSRRAGVPPLVGFHERESETIVDMHDCAVLHPALLALAAPLRKLAEVVLTPGGTGAALLTRLESGVDCLMELPDEPDLAMLEALAGFAQDQDLSRLSWRVGEKGRPIPVAERRAARVVFAGVPVNLPEGGFLQASEAADIVLTELVFGGIGDAKRIADLYAGIGTFTFALAQRGPVHAADSSRTAIAALVAAAARAGLANRIAGEVRDLAVNPLRGAELAGFDAVVFDPPRAGAAAQARALAEAKVPRIVAVSCYPASFARDARILVDGGYRLTQVIPVDQFVWSPHVELVAWFER